MTQILLVLLFLFTTFSVADAAKVAQGNCGGSDPAAIWTLDNTTKDSGACTVTIPSPCTTCVLVVGSGVVPSGSGAVYVTDSAGVIHELLLVENGSSLNLPMQMFHLPLSVASATGSVPAAGVMTLHFTSLAVGSNTNSLAGWFILDGVDNRAPIDTTKATSVPGTADPKTIAFNATGLQQTVSFYMTNSASQTVTSVTGTGVTKHIDFTDGSKRFAGAVGGAATSHVWDLAFSGATGVIGAVFQPTGTVNATTGTVPEFWRRRFLQILTFAAGDPVSPYSGAAKTVADAYNCWNTGDPTEPGGCAVGTWPARTTSAAANSPAGNYQGDGHDYYDGRKIWQNIAVILNNSAYNNIADMLIDAMSSAYEVPQDYGLPGYRHFSEGYLLAWQRTGNAAYAARAKRLAGGVGYSGSAPGYSRDCGTVGTYVFGEGPGSGICEQWEMREVAYALRDTIVAQRMGSPSTGHSGTLANKLTTLIGQVNSRLNYTFPNQGRGAGQDPGELFMVGLAAKSLIMAWEETGDSRVPPMIALMANHLWANRAPTQMAQRYSSAPQCPTQPCSGAYPYDPPSGFADLDMLMAPVFYRAALFTGNELYAKRGDVLVNGWTIRGGAAGPKQFNQGLHWYEGLAWRAQFYACFAASTCGGVSADPSAPTGVLVTSPPASTVSGTITFSGTGTDNVGVASMRFNVGGAQSGAIDTSPPFTQQLDTAAFPDATYSLTVTACDAMNNCTTSPGVSVAFSNAPPSDVTAPNGSITSPPASTTVSGAAVSVSTNCSDAGPGGCISGQLKVDGANVGSLNTTSPFTFVLNSTLLTNAAHLLSVRFCDAAANCADTPTVSITVSNSDTTLPLATLTDPIEGQTIFGTYTMRCTASDNIAVQEVKFRVGTPPGNLLGPNDPTAPYTLDLNTLSMANGTYQFWCRAEDTAHNLGNSALVNVTILNDSTAPTGVAVTAPALDAVLVGDITYSGSCTDNIAVGSVQFKVNGTIVNTDTVSPFTFTLQTGTFANGPYVLSITCLDTSGNQTTSATRAVTINNPVGDVIAPVVVVTNPTGTVAGTHTLRATCTDAVGCVSVTFKRVLDNAAVGPSILTAPFEMSWDSTQWPYATFAFYAYGCDAANNCTSSSPETLTMGNTQTPTLRFKSRSKGKVRCLGTCR